MTQENDVLFSQIVNLRGKRHMTEILRELDKLSMGEQVEVTKAAARLMEQDKKLDMAAALKQALENLEHEKEA